MTLAAHQPQNLAPVLLVRDIQASVAWYMEKLGFRVNELHGEPPSFAIANFGDHCSIMLKQSSGGAVLNHQSLTNMWDVYIWVGNIGATHAHLISRNVDIVCGPQDQPYGCREIEIRDPDGYILCLGECR